MARRGREQRLALSGAISRALDVRRSLRSASLICDVFGCVPEGRLVRRPAPGEVSGMLRGRCARCDRWALLGRGGVVVLGP